MQDIYKYIPEPNHVCRVHSVAAVLYLQFVLHGKLVHILKVLFLNIGIFRSMCAVSNTAVCCSS
jgi:hypothetical protein